MNILFINPATLTKTDQSAYLEQRDSVGHGYLVRPTIGFVQPMGILELASYVRSKIDDISIQLIDFGVELFLLSKHQDRPRMTVEYFSSSIIDRQKDIPDVVGISILFSTSYNSSMMIAELAKKKWPHAVVVIGGVAATHSYKKILTNQVVDYVIRGEAEIAFTQLVQSINSDHNNIVDIDGVIDQTKLSTGSSRMASMVDNLDDIPIPAYDLLDMDLYVKEDRVAMMFSRGCPFKCTFCASPSVHGHGIRERSNEKIKGEIAYLIDHWGIKSLTVYDDLIAANRKKFLEL